MVSCHSPLPWLLFEVIRSQKASSRRSARTIKRCNKLYICLPTINYHHSPVNKKINYCNGIHGQKYLSWISNCIFFHASVPQPQILPNLNKSCLILHLPLQWVQSTKISATSVVPWPAVIITSLQHQHTWVTPKTSGWKLKIKEGGKSDPNHHFWWYILSLGYYNINI